MRIKVLGTGAVTTKPPEPQVGKFGPSILITSTNGNILIDVGKDVLVKTSKEELLNITDILITHGHRDAIDGLSILNKFLEENKMRVNLYALPQVLDIIKLHNTSRNIDNFIEKPIAIKKEFDIKGIIVKAIKVFHAPNFPTVAYNFDKVFFYGADFGPVFDEYETTLISNQILAIMDGAYWDKQRMANHVAVLPNLDYILSLNNKFTYFTGMGNDWPSLSEADAVLKDKLEEYKKTHPDCKVQELRAVKEGEQFEIDMNKILPIDERMIMKPAFSVIISDPTILGKISDKELLFTHLRCHQLWGVKKTKEVLQVHVLVVKEMLKRGMQHHIVNDLDKETSRILGIQIKAYGIWNELSNEITLKSNIISFVGSAIYSENPNDIDIITPQCLEKVLQQFLNKYNPHFLGEKEAHGDIINIYDLILRKKDLMVVNNLLPDYTISKYYLCKKNPSLSMAHDTYIVEPYIEGKAEIVIDKENKIIYEKVVTIDGMEIVTDALCIKRNNFFKEMLIDRLYFMHKQWLDKVEPKLLPIRWVVKKDHLFNFLKNIKNKYSKVIIRPASSKYYDGKFICELSVICQSCKNPVDYEHIPEVAMGAIECPICHSVIDQTGKVWKEVLAPGQIFKPLKATGSSYHELSYFNPKDAWTFFGQYGVTTEGKVRFEYKIDGWRSIWQAKTNKDTLVYFEDSKVDESKKFPGVISELNNLHTDGIILDGEMMEDLGNHKWASRHDLMRWSQAKEPGSDDNIRVLVYDILYYNGDDLHNKPLSERLKILKEVAKKFKKYYILCPGKDITIEAELTAEFNSLKSHPGELGMNEGNGIDGLMGKLYSGNYSLNGRTSSWMKLKFSLESHVMILDRINNAGSTYGYKVGYSIPQPDKDKFTPVEDLNGVYYGVLGTTFNTKIKAEAGQVLNIAALEYKKEEVDNKVKYTLFQARVISLEPDKKEADSYKIIDKLSTSSTKSVHDFFVDKVKPKTGGWTIKEGMTGKYCVQYHVRGLKPELIKSLSDTDIEHMGADPKYFIPSDSVISELSSITGSVDEWKQSIDIASKPTESSQKLTTLVNQVIASDKFKTISASLKHSLALIDPVSIHQDIRLVPDKTYYFEGGEWTTPGNQYKENLLLQINNHVYCQFRLKVPHVDNSSRAEEPVIRGPASWLTVGDSKPEIVPPNSIGSTSKDYASFYVHEKGTWLAGRQTSPHGNHFKLFQFKGKLFNGWYIFMWAPIGPQQQRIWLFYMPKDQSKYEQKSERDNQFLTDVEDIYKKFYNWTEIQKVI